MENETHNLSDIVEMLETETPDGIRALFERAYEVKRKRVGNAVHLRGIVEFSNVCPRNCLYCGIRAGNSKVERYQMTKEEILDKARWIYENRYGSIVMQSGERNDPEFVDFVEDATRRIKEIGDGALGITLSLGEQTEDTYKRWFDAGAHRYLLRIETSDPKLYAAIHPEDASFEKRVECLDALKRIGYQVGTGVMIGLPGQSTEQLARDVLFFKERDIDMIGMGPFIPHKDTPLAEHAGNFDPAKQLELGLKMIAATRIVLENVNIAAATALHALKDDGRELGLKAGANVVMPNVTDAKYRGGYRLYDNKPLVDETGGKLFEKIEAAGDYVEFDAWGDSPRFFERRKQDADDGEQ